MGWWARRKRRRDCWHHEYLTGFSWIKWKLIDTGMRKMFWCTRCQQTWFN